MQPSAPVEWATSEGLIAYDDAVSIMEQRAASIREGNARELVWLLEHPALYTAGTSAKAEDLLTPERFPVHKTGRGGQYTYHGPGQRVAYIMLDVTKRGRDVRKFVEDIEGWLISALHHWQIKSGIRDGRVGVWVERDSGNGQRRDDKIAAIGIRMRRWVSFHGLSLNVCPNLEHFTGIVPCGISQHGVTSLTDLGVDVTMADVDAVLRRSFEEKFQRTTTLQAAPNLSDKRESALHTDTTPAQV